MHYIIFSSDPSSSRVLENRSEILYVILIVMTVVTVETVVTVMTVVTRVTVVTVAAGVTEVKRKHIVILTIKSVGVFTTKEGGGVNC